MISLRSTISRFLLLTLGVAGCNAILDNNRGHLDATQSPTTLEPNEPATSTDTDAGSSTSSEDGCAATQKRCNGACVSKDDPSYGCSAASCTACSTTNATPACGATGSCSVKACDPGYADCNGKAEDGCEVDLTLAASCGACGTTCDATKPVCAPSAKSFACSTGCTADAPLLCGTSCVSPLTSANHCGGCDTKCPTVVGGTETCQTGVCTLTCKTGYHACGATTCAADTDATACGPTCAVCPVPANGTAVCSANACGLASCTAGYGDCNMNAADGCEVNFANDPLHCGDCMTSCHGGACLNKVCQRAPDAAAP